MIDCIEFRGNRDVYGYGRVSAKTEDGRYITVKAHRVAYCEAHGLELDEIDGWVVRHTCDNRGCVNPEHLLLGTNADNVQDRHMRGRNATSCGHGMCKLADEQVLEIRQRLKKGSKGPDGAASLAKEFGVHRSTILKLASGARRELVS